ncbi:MAG: phage holin family protein [Pirellulales bacterium]
MATAETETRNDRYRAAGDSRSLADLWRQLRNEMTALLRQEVALAKTETTEKVSRVARNGMYLAIGGLVAYAGVILLLVAATAGLYVGLVAAGLTNATSGWLAPLIIGVVVAVIGYALVQKALSTLRRESVVPERTVHSLQRDQQWAKEKVKS